MEPPKKGLRIAQKKAIPANRFVFVCFIVARDCMGLMVNFGATRGTLVEGHLNIDDFLRVLRQNQAWRFGVVHEQSARPKDPGFRALRFVAPPPLRCPTVMPNKQLAGAIGRE